MKSGTDLLESAQNEDRIRGLTQLAGNPSWKSLAIVQHLAEVDPALEVRYLARKICQVIRKALVSARPAAGKSPPPQEVAAILAGDKPEPKIALAESLGQEMPSATAYLIARALQREENPFVIAAFIKGIGSSLGDDALVILVPFLQHPDSRVRADTVESIEISGSPRGFPLLVNMLLDPDNRVRANAAIALRRIPGVPALATLRDMVNSGNPAFAASAAFAMRHFPHAENVPLLVKMLENQDLSVRRHVRETLAKFSQVGIDQARQALVANHLAIPSGEDVDTLLCQVVESERCVIRLREGLASGDTTTRLAAIAEAVEAGGLGIGQVLISHLEEENEPSVLARILQTLGALRVEEALPAFGRALGHPNQVVQASAIAAIRNMGNPAILESVRPFMQSPDPELRASAVLAMAAKPGFDPAGPLKGMLSSPEQKAQKAAVHAIGELAWDRLHRLLKESLPRLHPTVAGEARELLASTQHAVGLGVENPGNLSTAGTGPKFNTKTVEGDLSIDDGEKGCLPQSAFLPCPTLECPQCGKAMFPDLERWACLHCPQKLPLAATADLPEVKACVDLNRLPSLLSFPIADFFTDPNPVMRLWHIANTVELTLRLLVPLGIRDLQNWGGLDRDVLATIRDRIGQPMLGQWLGMAQGIALRFDLQKTVLEGFSSFVGNISLFLEGDGKGRKGGFIEVRNDLAHSGSVSLRIAENHLLVWKPRFAELLGHYSWLYGFPMVVRVGEGRYGVLRGLSRAPVPISKEMEESLSVAFGKAFQVGNEIICPAGTYRGGVPVLLPLWPLTFFGPPEEPGRKAPDGAPGFPQLFMRRDNRFLRFSAIGADEACHSLQGEGMYDRFAELFHLEEPDTVAEFRTESQRLIGRDEAVATVKKALGDSACPVLWASGVAGVGKSCVIARVIMDLLPPKGERTRLLVPFRFRNGTDRNNRNSFLRFALDQLREFLPPPDQNAGVSGSGGGKKSPRGDQAILEELQGLLGRMGERTALFVLDGLDELDPVDPDFGEEVVFRLASTRVHWLCSGRPESHLLTVFRSDRCHHVFPGGLPKLTLEEVRSILVSRVEQASRRRILAADLSNRLFEKVFEVSGGLPVYVNCFLEDILGRRWKNLETGSQLPRKLEEYFEELLSRIAAQDKGEEALIILSILEVAREPLDEIAIGEILVQGEYIPEDESGNLGEHVRTGLARLSQIVRLTPNDEGRVGHIPYHDSLRRYLPDSPTLKGRVALARQKFGKLALEARVREGPAGRYFLRHGLCHLLEARKDRWKNVSRLLTDRRYLAAKLQAGLAFELVADFSAAWDKMPETPRKDYWEIQLLGRALQTNIHFLANHPHLLLQELWNRGWWHDARAAAPHFVGGGAGRTSTGPWSKRGRKLSGLLERFRAETSDEVPDLLWLKALRPPPARLDSPERFVLPLHSRSVNAVACSPTDCSLIASGSNDQTLRLWDAETGKLRRSIPFGERELVLSLAFSPDGKLLAAGLWTGVIRLLDPVSGGVQGELSGPAVKVLCLAFSSDGARLLSGSEEDGTVRLWNVQKRLLVREFPVHKARVTGVAFWPDGKLAVSASFDGSLRLTNLETGDSRELERFPDPVLSMALSSGERRLIASSSLSGEIRISEPRDQGARQMQMEGTECAAGCLSFTPDGTSLVFSSPDHAIRVRQIEGGKETSCLHGHTDHVTSLSVSPHGNHLVSGGTDRTVRVWDLRDTTRAVSLAGHTGDIFRAVVSPDGSRVASWGKDGTIRLWDADLGTELGVVPGDWSEVNGVAFFPDGMRLVVAGPSPDVWVFEVGDPSKSKVLEGHHQDHVAAVAISPDGKRILSGGRDKAVILWDVVSGKPLAPKGASDSLVTAAVFSADGALAAVGDDGGTIFLLDGFSGKRTPPLKAHSKRILSLSFSRDKRYLVSGSEDGSFRLWDLTKLQAPIFAGRGHQQPVTGAAVSPDGKRVLSVTSDRRVWLWDVGKSVSPKVEKGFADPVPFGAGPDVFPFLATLRGPELVVEDARTGNPVAWHPAESATAAFTAHPDGRRWILWEGSHLQILSLEGFPD